MSYFRQMMEDADPGLIDLTLKTHKSNLEESQYEKLGEHIHEMLTKFTPNEIETITRTLISLLSTFRASFSYCPAQRTNEQYYCIYKRQIEKFLKAYQEADKDNLRRCGLLATALYPLIFPDQTFITDYPKAGNPVADRAHLIIRCRNVQELMMRYLLKKHYVQLELCKINILDEIPFRSGNSSDLKQYQHLIHTKFPQKEPSELLILILRWCDEVGLDTIPSGKIIDSQYWATYETLKRNIDALETNLEILKKIPLLPYHK